MDTNVLVRYLAQDDEAQLRAVLTLLLKKGATFFVPDLVLIEADWVLTTVYQWTAEEIAEAFGRLLSVHNLLFENEGRIRAALRALRQGADLSDELIVDRCREMGCKTVATFDKGIIKRHPGFAVIPK
ncbi:type II toxin-antitoxin system VapC family toxin [Prosthecobacter sp.]|uniref:type II toxin-antitoxin system VapC family toxin n=1 Tax=Prosthecobacter sp. TaxID=1965333 RepID=UPI0024878636|nr:type II toxin-antitoxin system VapC family toxin [Prosthecobacter sp.]MDI1315383.1 type II toxin-antitoxin system VapC family toxin [Prosthecobacter sp.]